MRENWIGFVLLYAALLAACALAFVYGPLPVRIAVFVFTAVVVALTFLNPAYAYRRLGTSCMLILFAKAPATASGSLDLTALVEREEGLLTAVATITFGKMEPIVLVLLFASAVFLFALDRAPEVLRRVKSRTIAVRIVEHSLFVDRRDTGLVFSVPLDVTAVGDRAIHVSDAGIRLRMPLHRLHWFGLWYEHPAMTEVKATAPLRIDPGDSLRIRIRGEVASWVVQLLSRVPNLRWLSALTHAADLPVILRVRTSEEGDALCPVTVRPGGRQAP